MRAAIRSGWMLAFGVLLGAALAVFAMRYGPELRPDRTSAFATEYQAVLLTNGEAYYGKMEALGTSYPRLSDVHYIQRRADAKESAKFVLVKRGREWHRPDRMIINAAHIVLIEPVHPESDVAKAIADSHRQ